MRNYQLPLSDLLGERMKRDVDSIYAGGNFSVRRLMDMVHDYLEGRLLLPVHQRELSWPTQKQEEYIETLCIDSAPPGSFEIYRIVKDGRESPEFLNDGAQRLLTALFMFQHPERFELSPEEVERILRGTEYIVRMKKHRSHQEALERFHAVNSNVPLTPYQFTRGTIIYSMGDEMGKEWETWLEKLQEGVQSALTVVTHRRIEHNPKGSRAVALTHKSYRQTTSMFYRFVSQDRKGVEYSVSAGTLKQGKPVFETDLSKYLRELGLENSWKLQEKFHRLIDNEAGLIRAIWEDIDKPERRMRIHSATVRWLWDLSIWRRNCEVPAEPWMNFVRALLDNNKGATEVFCKSSTGRLRRMSLSFGRVRAFRPIALEIGSDLADWFDNPRKQPNILLEDGFQHSHVVPFSTNGNGVTVSEPSILNLSRGARPLNNEAINA